MAAPRSPYGFIPRTRAKKFSRARKGIPFAAFGIAILIAGGIFLSLPVILAEDAKLAQRSPYDGVSFPVTVDPATKTIQSTPQIEALLATPPTQLSASADLAHEVFQRLALWVADTSVYQQVASAAGAPTLFVSIPAGSRQEQVASAFGAKLHWTAAQRKEFAAEAQKLEPSLTQGSTVPGIYFASASDPDDVASLVDERFSEEILSRYSSSTNEQVPLDEAITVASLIQREAGGWDDMRMISGIIWNRIFAGMKLQIDATLQYSEANQDAGADGWWPSVEPDDKYIKSTYNTYQHVGLPPGPIANPSIAAVVAALNPKQTDCLFYFHDQHGQFHCSKTYEEHVALLKKYYGRGK